MYPPALKLCRRINVFSFVAAPLKSKDRILGYVAGDFRDRRCTDEDLELLITIASHIAVAIDNAQAYQALEHLTQTLEQRVRQRTQELQSANERLVELDELRAAFVSIVSHELRTPMTSIKGYVENMLDGLTGPLTDRQSYYLTRVKLNVERLTRMLNQLLDLNRIENRRVELQLAAMSMPDLAQDVVEGLQSLAQKKAIALATHTEGEVPNIQGDRDKLHQVLTNLVGNAIKFTPEGGDVRVEVTALSEGLVRVCVSDTGCGIGPHEIEKVFEKFYRGESAPQEALGAGLGLPITKSLVELHGGRIWVDSVLDAGSQFYFTVPIAGPPDRHTG
jgi:two-component system sensor histidine kinase/response regulator